jgi:hypothetical protein
VAQLRQFDPAATWEVKRFGGLPYLTTEAGCFVEVAVTVRGVTLSQIHPVLDAKNRPILAPTAFDVNTSIQRCLVKAIALHGLGLCIYAGEDLPTASDELIVATVKPVAVSAIPIRSTNGISKVQIAQIEHLLAETGSERSKLLAYFGVEALAEISITDYPV